MNLYDLINLSDIMKKELSDIMNLFDIMNLSDIMYDELE